MTTETGSATDDTATETATAAGGRGSSRARRLVGIALCLATIVLAVLDTNIVSAATVPIARDLDPAGGLARIPWLVSGFQLAATAALPLYGKLSDSLGAKKVFLAAVATFLTGSALCGLAQNMGQLIAARALQGIGGGGLMSITLVVIRLIGLSDGGRAAGGGKGGRGGGPRGAGMGGIMAGAGMAVGPWIGGLLTQHLSWRWIFYVNLPLGVAILVAAVIFLDLPAHPVRQAIDYVGAALAAAFATALLLVLEWGGSRYAWASPQILGMAVGVCALLGLFLWRQATAAEPVLPLPLFRGRALPLSFAVQGLVGVAMTVTIVYVMVYLQAARQVAAASAGLQLLPMALGMGLSGLIVGRLGAARRSTLVTGTSCAAVALALLGTSSADSSLWWLRGELLLAGAGFGMLLGQLLQYGQEFAPPGQLGVTTTAVRFFQTLGGALGTSLFGSLLTRLSGDSPGVGSGVGSGDGHLGFVAAIDIIFFSQAALLALASLLALRLPNPPVRE